MTDQEIDNAVHKAGGRWNGDAWVIEDADLYPFVRSILATHHPQAPASPQPEAEAQPFTYEGSHIAADGTVTYVSGEAYQPPQRQEAAQVEAAIEDGEFEPGQWTQSAQWAIQQNPGGTLRIIAQLKRQLAEALASSRVAAPTMQAVKVPLTEGQIERGRQDHGGERHDFTAGVRYAESFHGIQPSEGERSHD